MTRSHMEMVRKDIAVIKSRDYRFINLTDAQVEDLYCMYSAETACAGWLMMNDGVFHDFCGWAFETPVQRVLKES